MNRNMKLKLLFLIIAFTIILLKGYAQTSYSLQYGYDQAGNRITRNIIHIQKVDTINRNISIKESENYSSFKSSLQTDEGLIILGVYPNPIDNFLNISISAPYVECRGSYQIIAYNGQLALTGNIYSNHTVVDISNISSGKYILKINLLNSEKGLKFNLIKQ